MRTQLLTIRLTDEEHDIYNQAADLKDTTVSELMRKVMASYIYDTFRVEVQKVVYMPDALQPVLTTTLTLV